jgi:hypothetical protein
VIGGCSYNVGATLLYVLEVNPVSEAFEMVREEVPNAHLGAR